MSNEIERLRRNVETIARRENEHPGLWTDELRAALGKLAQAEHADYPQYDGHWSGPEWTVVKLNRRVKTKLGVAFEKGELALACRTLGVTDIGISPTTWTVYSVRNRCDTVVSPRTCKRV